jgi:truncated hemoglobin YjbI
MWEALDRGPRLRRILEDFYAQVYSDPRLAPFFAHTTIGWAIDHQYSFLAEIWSGVDSFFGDRPRNAHNWMVISHELFDHREAVMEACLRRHELPEDLIVAWRALDESYRSHIVKDSPFPKKRRGVSLPLDGYASLQLSIGILCDGCSAEVADGSTVHYHRGTGQTYCLTCRPSVEDASADDPGESP